MTDTRACVDYRNHGDAKRWRVTAGKTDGTTAHYSAWTCTRHLTGTVQAAEEFTGLIPSIVPSRSGLDTLRDELKPVAEWAR